MALSNRWYRYYPLEFQHGIHGLSLEQIGAYQQVLNLIYLEQGPVPDDDRWLAGQMGISTRKWRNIRQVLLDAGKLHAADGQIDNPRARQLRENGPPQAGKPAETRLQQRKSQGNSQEIPQNPPFDSRGINDLQASTGPVKDKKTEEKDSDTPPHPSTHHPADEGAMTGVDTSPETGTRLPTRWHPTRADRDYAAGKGFTDDEITAIAENFRDHWHAQPGDRGRRADWGAMWRTWLRRERTWHPPGRAGTEPGNRPDTRQGRPGGSARAASGGGALGATRRILAEMGAQQRPEPGTAGPATPSPAGGPAPDRPADGSGDPPAAD